MQAERAGIPGFLIVSKKKKLYTCPFIKKEALGWSAHRRGEGRAKKAEWGFRWEAGRRGKRGEVNVWVWAGRAYECRRAQELMVAWVGVLRQEFTCC